MVAAAVVAAGVVTAAATAYSANQSSSSAAAARAATTAGAGAGALALESTTKAGLKDINSSTAKALGSANKAAAGYSPFISGGTGALTKLETLLGIKGGGGAALKALENTPGYKFAQQQGDEATVNAATATGMNMSGNTLEALSKYNQGLADSTYNTEVGNLENMAGMGLQATSGAAGADLTAAGIEAGAGSQEAQLLSNEGTGIANVNIGQGTNDANISMAQAASNSALAGNLAGNISNDFLLASMSKGSDGYDTDFYERHKPCRN